MCKRKGGVVRRPFLGAPQPVVIAVSPQPGVAFAIGRTRGGLELEPQRRPQEGDAGGVAAKPPPSPGRFPRDGGTAPSPFTRSPLARPPHRRALWVSAPWSIPPERASPERA